VSLEIGAGGSRRHLQNRVVTIDGQAVHAEPVTRLGIGELEDYSSQHALVSQVARPVLFFFHGNEFVPRWSSSGCGGFGTLSVSDRRAGLAIEHRGRNFTHRN
jgi:hypothetical protein